MLLNLTNHHMLLFIYLFIVHPVFTLAFFLALFNL